MKYSWYSRASNQKSPDTIHQILAFGTLDDIRTIKKIIGKEKARELFLRYPKKVYTLAGLKFIKNFILNITGSIDDAKYLKNTPRRIG